ncbi:hypothetical protein GJAV_G00219120 [Gymnothorax javanicus]|nr:hypothetical protein GJAV_G00219120 [Gymnothorax javanicus]
MSARGEMGILLAAFLLCGVALSAADAGLFEKDLVFPEETDNSYVTLTPQKPLELTAFTLCMNVATELKDNRDVILFAYRTDTDELNVWREADGRYSLYLTDGSSVRFNLPPLTTFKTHFCVTWESTTGLTAMWMDRKRSDRKIFRNGHTTRAGGTVRLGQDTDSGGFDINQSFVGKISDLNMWDYVLPESQIKALHSCFAHNPKGNIFDWETIQYQINGNVLVASAGS